MYVIQVDMINRYNSYESPTQSLECYHKNISLVFSVDFLTIFYTCIILRKHVNNSERIDLKEMAFL